MEERGKIIVIVAPSGTGKSSLINRLKGDFPDLLESVSHTTRSPREGEVNGTHYFFTKVGLFKEMIEAEKRNKKVVKFGFNHRLHPAVIKAKDKGVTNFSLIHDSFGCVAPDVHKLSEAIREAFCEVYEQDVLTNWAMEMKQMLSDKNAKKFPHIPERGNLDLSLVKQSIFFCV